MKKIDIIKACSDLGVHKGGADLGPDAILENTKVLDINKIYEVRKIKCNKELDKNNKRKNIDYINSFNAKLYTTVSKSIEENSLPIILGGDHSIAIGSALASINKYNNLGIIWIDSHSDYHTFDTTMSGNIHGLPFAAITGQVVDELSKFHKGKFYNPKNSVLVGARSIDYPGEYENLEKAGITIFTTEDIKKEGMSKILQKAIKIASNGTEGIHISVDVDVIDPKFAPGVSVPELDGINKDEFLEAIDEISKNEQQIKSIDLVEYNPLFDIDSTTLNIVSDALRKLI